MDIPDCDVEAFERAIALCRAEDAEQIDAKLARQPWAEVGRSAALHCQIDSLR